MLMVLHNHNCGKVDIDITIMKKTSQMVLIIPCIASPLLYSVAITLVMIVTWTTPQVTHGP